MKRQLRHLGWGIFVVLILAVTASLWWLHAEEMKRRETQATESWLASVIIPKLEFREKTPAEAVAILRRGIEAEPRHPRGLRIVIASDEASKKVVRRPLNGPPNSTPGLEGPGISPTIDRSITVSLQNIPLNSALEYVAGLSGRKWWVKGRTIMLYRCPSGCTVSPLVTVEWRMPPDLVAPSTKDPLPWTNCEEFVTGNGITIYEGGFARWDPKTGRMRIRTTAEQLDITSHGLPSPVP